MTRTRHAGAGAAGRRARPAARWLLALALAFLSPALPSAAQEVPSPEVDRSALPRALPPRSLSTSRQFIIYADSGPLRAAVSQAGDEAKDGLLQLLGLRRDVWKVPIVVDLRRPPAGLPGALPPSRLTLGQTGAGLKIQLELLLGESSRGVHLREELVRALLLEIAYRDAPDLPAGRAFRPPPPWLVEGCSAWLETRAEDAGAVADSLAAVLGAPRAALPLADFLSKDPAGMDSTSRALYRAYAYGLVWVLSEETKGGREALVTWLRELPGSGAGPADPGPGPLLARLLPETAAGSPAALDQWWAAARARLAAARRAAAVLSTEETERQLAALLTVTVPGGKAAGKSAETTAAAASQPAAGRVFPVEEFEKYLVRGRQPGRRSARAENTRRLAPVRAGLLALLGRAHPFYRGIVAGYEAAAGHLARGDTHRGGALLQALAAERAQARTRQEAVSDYLNWLEATQPSAPSGAFEPYFQAARQLEAETRRRARRSDPVSAYLDAVETELP